MYNEKDKILREIYHKRDHNIYIIQEDGKQRLEKNLNIIISKLRSIDFNIGIFVLIDSDNPINNITYIDKIYKKIQNFINNKRKFTRTPRIDLQNKNSFYGIVQIVYVTGWRLVIHILAIPVSLEYWLLDRKLNTVSKLNGVRWFTIFMDILSRYNILKDNLNYNTKLI